MLKEESEKNTPILPVHWFASLWVMQGMTICILSQCLQVEFLGSLYGCIITGASRRMLGENYGRCTIKLIDTLNLESMSTLYLKRVSM